MPHNRFDLGDAGREALQPLLDARDWLRENPERATGYALMFVVLIAIYARYLVDFIHAAQQGKLDGEEILSVGRIARFILFAGWPFALMRLLSARWTRRDAGNVATAAFCVVAAFWLHHYSLQPCLLALSLLSAPLTFSAVLGHAAGCLRPAGADPAQHVPAPPAPSVGSVQTRSWESLMDDTT